MAKQRTGSSAKAASSHPSPGSSTQHPSDSGEFVKIYPPKSASEHSNQKPAQGHPVPSREEKACTASFCGVSEPEHFQGPYLHEGKSASALRATRGYHPPWGEENPPQAVWEAWLESLPTQSGPPRQYSEEREQMIMDLVNGFTAHHAWFSDDGYTSAQLRRIDMCNEDWRNQRERGVLRPDLEDF